jgi:hypothetical protein
MQKFVKCPVIINAFQWDGDASKSNEFIDSGDWHYADCQTKDIIILTLEGGMLCKVGDWIIKGVKGEFYSCKPDIFEMTYESVK